MDDTSTDTTATTAAPLPASREVQAVYWRLLASCFGLSDRAPGFEAIAKELAAKAGLPDLVLDPALSIDTLVQRYPALRADFLHAVPRAARDDADGAGGDDDDAGASATAPAASAPTAEPAVSARPADALPPDVARVRRALVLSKLLLNAFGPNTQQTVVSAQGYSQWTRDLGWFEQACGYAPGSLRGKGGRGAAGASGSPTGTGGGRQVTEEDLRAGFAAMEGDLVKRMALREVLKDNQLAAKLTPSMALVEQLLRDKANLSGDALANARRLIKAYVDQLADVLKLKVEKASRGKVDRSVPPKRTFRNLDLKRTVWKNLTNWNDAEKRLYVDQLYFKRTATKTSPTRLIVVVDQSGSMVDAMVQSTILASIFAGLPNVDVHLLAFDTQVLDLTPWVKDPFEVLLRTNLGGGTLIHQALVEASKKIVEPKNTAMVLISDFFEGGSNQVLFDYIKSLKDSGVHFIPVGALTSSGYFSVCEWFRVQLKQIGAPILSGSVNKLILQLRYLLR